ncbi:MAG: hypothetical protein OEZ13_07475 [Spirochaetia bacterium]|nr:hypothetical protein [Spirochaetia bacterium]
MKKHKNIQNNSILKECEFPIIKHFLLEKSKESALVHMSECSYCLEKITALTGVLKEDNIERLLADDKKTALSEDEIIKLAEAFAENPSNLKDLHPEESEILFSDNKSLELFQIIAASLQKDFQKSLKKTPDYLKNIAFERLKSEKTSSERFYIKIKNGIKLIGEFADNLFVIPQTAEAAAFRSALPVEHEALPSSLSFYTKNDKERILYHAVQDGPNTVMISIKIQNFSPGLKTINLRKEGRILRSHSAKDDTAYFSRISPGLYYIELKDAQNNVIKDIELNILNS